MIKEFICLTKYLNFSEAAFMLHVSQPTLSRHIASLEYELNTTLFNRNKSTGSLTLTSAGETFLADAKKIVRCYDSAIEHISNINAGFKKSLTIGYRRLYHSTDWNDIFQGFSSKYPNTHIQFASYEDFSLLYSDLNSGNIDISISVNINDYNKKGIQKALFTASSFGCSINVDHPLADREYITFSDLHETDILLPSPEFNLSFIEYLNHQFELANAKPIVYQYMKRIEDADMLVKLDYGINLVPSCYYVETSRRVVFRPLKGTEESVPVYCFIKENNPNPAAKDFMQFCKSFHYPDI